MQTKQSKFCKWNNLNSKYHSTILIWLDNSTILIFLRTFNHFFIHSIKTKTNKWTVPFNNNNRNEAYRFICLWRNVPLRLRPQWNIPDLHWNKAPHDHNSSLWEKAAKHFVTVGWPVRFILVLPFLFFWENGTIHFKLKLQPVTFISVVRITRIASLRFVLLE